MTFTSQSSTQICRFSRISLNNYKSLSFTTINDQHSIVKYNKIMDQHYCVKNNQVPCIRIFNIKIVDGFQTQRHLDTILIQSIARVGPINRILICNNPRFADAIDNESTLAVIELVNHNNHEELRSMLSGYYFHGLKWTVSLAFHLFHGLDTNYRPLAHPCTTCSRLGLDLYDHTHLQREQTRSLSRRIL